MPVIRREKSVNSTFETVSTPSQAELGAEAIVQAETVGKAGALTVSKCRRTQLMGTQFVSSDSARWKCDHRLSSDDSCSLQGGRWLLSVGAHKHELWKSRRSRNLGVEAW